MSDMSGRHSTEFVVISIRGVDTERAILRFGGDQSLYIRWLREFSKLAPESFRVLYEHFRSNQKEDLQTVLTFIKTQAGMLGLQEVLFVTEQLDLSIKNGEWPRLWLDELDFSLRDVCNEIVSVVGLVNDDDLRWNEPIQGMSEI